ncbi:MAG: J domain-containing protein [Deltaproteobacteria bacterium]|nr:J domain-containing protein [Deltaproteobacteria bacterium]
MKKDYYQILGVPKDATDEDIKKTYRRLARKYHPDLHPNDKSAEARFKEINEAHSILSDPKKRADYDMTGRVFEPGPAGAGGFGGYDFNLGGVEDVFKNFFGARFEGAGTRMPEHGQDIEHVIEIDFLQAVKGTEARIIVSRPSGKEKITVKIPTGVADGQRVRVLGKGRTGAAGGRPGDLYIITHVRPHLYFKRAGDDIHIDLPITIEEAVLGAEIEVPTLDGMTKVKVPPGTQSGQRLRLKGKGIRSSKGIGSGDQYLDIKIMIPRNINQRTKRLIEEMNETNPYEPRSGLW